MIRSRIAALFGLPIVLMAGLRLSAQTRVDEVPEPQVPVAAPALVERTVKSLGATDGMFDNPVVSPDGDRVAHVKDIGDRGQRVVVNGEAGLLYVRVFGDTLCFSGDGVALAYAAVPEGAAPTLVVEKQERLYVHGPGGFSFSPDGKHLAYPAAVPGRGGTSMYRDGASVARAEASGRPVFSPDGRHLAFSAWRRPWRTMVLDGKDTGEYEDLRDPVFSRDSSRVAYAACQKGKWGVVGEGRITGPYDDVGRPVYSTDGTVLAHKASLAGKWFVVWNKEKSASYDDMRDPVFALIGNRMAWAATDRANWFVVCEGKPGKGYSEVADPVFSIDGTHLAYAAVSDGKSIVVCDGRESPDLADVRWLGFSPDSRHLAVVASRDGEYSLIIDGREGPAHARIEIPRRYDALAGKMRCVVFDRTGTAGVLNVSLVEVDWPADRTWENAFAAGK